MKFLTNMSIFLMFLLCASGHDAYAKNGYEREAIVRFSKSADSRALLARELKAFDYRELIGGDYLLISKGSLRGDELVRHLIEKRFFDYVQRNTTLYLASPPNDSYYSYQWSLNLIDVEGAWVNGYGGSGVGVAVIDTGIANHPDIQWDNKRYNAYDGTGNVFDSSAWKHGVGVSGVIGAKTNNGLGIAGVCKNCAIIPVKVADEDGSISMASLISAIYWVASQNIKVANISIEASGQCSVTSQPALLLAINNAVSSGVVIVAAAGNGGGFVSDVVPASCPGVISVGAVNQNSELASYSNMGAVLVAPGGGGGFSWPDYTAYGSGIGCPYNDVDSYFQSNTNGNFIAWVSSPASGSVPCYRYLSGTSFAAPHVAGVVAMMRAANSTLSPSAIEFILKITATHLPSCGVSCGAGLLNAGSAVFFAKAVGITP